MAAIIFPTDPDRLNYTSSPWSDPNGKQWLFVPAIEAWDPFLSAGGGGGGDALTSNPLSQFAATTSLQLKGVISDETGSGALVFATSPTLVTPALGTPTSGNFSSGTFTWPTFNQNTTGSAGSVTGLSVTSGKTLTAQNSITLSGTDGSTLAIGTGGTLGTAAFTAATTYAAASKFIAGAGALTGPASPLTIGTAAGATLGTGAGQVPITGDYATAAHNHGAASGTAYDDQSSTNKGNLLKTDSFGSIRVNEAHANNLKMFGNDSRTAHFYVDTVDVQLGASRSYKAPNADGIVALTASTTGIPDKVALAEGNGIALDPSMSADEKWTGLTMDGTAGETLAVGDLCYLDVTATEWKLADADASGTCGPVILGLCILAGNDGAATRMLTYGTMRSAAFPASIALGAPVYVSTTAGDITATAPSGASDFVRIVGYAITAEPNTIFFNPSNTFIELTA